MVGVGKLLRQPPRVFAACPVVVIGVADPVQGCRIDGIAEHVFERAVRAAVPGNLRVTVELTAQQLVFLATGLDPVLPDAPDRFALLYRLSH